MKVRTITLLFAALLCSAATSAQTLYKIVGADGKITYSDRQPEGIQGKAIKFASAPKPSAQIQTQKSKVVLYSAVWCGYCTKAKAYMAAANIRFEEVDVDTAVGRDAFARASGSAAPSGKGRVGGIPYLVMGDQTQRGYSSQGYDRFFASLREQVRRPGT